MSSTTQSSVEHHNTCIDGFTNDRRSRPPSHFTPSPDSSTAVGPKHSTMTLLYLAIAR